MVKYRAVFLFVVAMFISCNNPSNTTLPVFEPKVISEAIQAPIPESEIHTLDSLLSGVMKNYRYNGNALVAIEGYPIFEYSGGYADLYTKTPLNFNTAFQIASVSKGFTAMCVMMLYEQGKINLSDTITKYIPEFPFERVTIKQLLQHTSGLQNYMYFVDNFWEKDKPITNEDILTLINEHNPQLNFRPGTRHLYNNTGYAILALLVERVSGRRFYEFVKEEIFDPLGMKHSFAWNKEVTDTLQNIATGFTRKGYRYRKFSHNPLDEVLGDKSIYTTIMDMLKWDQALYSNKLISDSLLNISFTKTKLSRSREYNYGYGWRLKEIDGKKVVYHNGLWNGFTATLTRYTDDEITIILLNNTNAPVASIVKQMYGVLKKELLTGEKLAESTRN